MANGRVREEVVNVALADLLGSRGVISTPELRDVVKSKTRLPDVVVAHFQGLRVVLEGKVGAAKSTRDEVLHQARKRVEEGLAHISIAVVYPPSVANAGSFGDVRRSLEKSSLDVAICSEARTGSWISGGVDELAQVLRRTFDELVEEDVVAESVRDIEYAVEAFSQVALRAPGSLGRCAVALGIAPDDPTAKSSSGYSAAQVVAVSRIAGLTLLNAMLFQEVLSADETRALPVRRCLSKNDRIDAFERHWRYILEEINYVPIFRVAREILLAMGASKDVEDVLGVMGQQALTIVSRRAALRHDLMGRVYHRLLVEQKYLATFYTSVPAATLLMKLALASEDWLVDWSDPTQIRDLRIVDLACGTGTLLMAAAEAVTDNHVTSCTRSGLRPDLRNLHKILMEQTIVGFDVLPSALHLTGSTLALRAAAVAFAETHLYSLPHGGTENQLGSIEFLRAPRIHVKHDLFGTEIAIGERLAGGEQLEGVVVDRPRADLCVMNPPFTRSVGGNLLFGSVPEAQRKRMANRLQRMLRGQSERGVSRQQARAEQRPPVMANATAGLGSVFVAVGNESLKDGGRLALVLPKALLSGVAWAKTRQLLSDQYQVEYIVNSHDPTRWNFSDNTELSEVLVIARRIGAAGTEDGSVTFLNLWRNPRTAFEAMNVAQTLTRYKAPDLELGQGSLPVEIGGRPAGEAISVPWSHVKRRSWMEQSAFAQADLLRTVHYLLGGTVVAPGAAEDGIVPLAQLGTLARLGPDRRDIWDGFREAGSRTTYPAVWGRIKGHHLSMTAEPNRYLAPLGEPRPGRPLRSAKELWKHAGRIVVAERLRLNTSRQIAILATERVLSNVWWPISLKEPDEQGEKALVLWLNSTLGLLIALGSREETQGAWVSLKKPAWQTMPVLDWTQLVAKEKRALAEAFDEVAAHQLEPLPQLAADETRQKIDHALSTILDLPDLAPLRAMLAREPVVSLQALG